MAIRSQEKREENGDNTALSGLYPPRFVYITVFTFCGEISVCAGPEATGRLLRLQTNLDGSLCLFRRTSWGLSPICTHEFTKMFSPRLALRVAGFFHI